MFIPEATGPEVLKVLQDYDHHHEWYPEVTDSRLLSSDSGVFKGDPPTLASLTGVISCPQRFASLASKGAGNGQIAA